MKQSASKRRLPHILAALATLLVVRTAGAGDVPEGVVYKPASAEVMASATQRLDAALKSGPHALAELFGPDNNDNRVLVGAFFGMEINADGLKARSVFTQGKYRMPVQDINLEVDSFAAARPASKRLLAHYLFLKADLSDARIRRPTFDELALMWFWIGWDLEDPVLIAQGAKETYVFDFDANTGLITWIERLTQPCFMGMQGDKQLLQCTCARVMRHGDRGQVGFVQQASCPAPAGALISSPSATRTPALPTAYLRLSDRTARTDGMAARAFGGEFSIVPLEEKPAGYQGVGKLLEGKPPPGIVDADGKPIPSYVLLASVIGSDGRVQANHVLLSTDPRASAIVLEAASGWRIEPARRDGKPVAELVWQELLF